MAHHRGAYRHPHTSYSHWLSCACALLQQDDTQVVLKASDGVDVPVQLGNLPAVRAVLLPSNGPVFGDSVPSL